MIDWNGDTLTLTFELWRVSEAVYKLINRVSLFLGRGYFWVNCGYCYRERGKMKCGMGHSSGETCIKEKCGIFNDEDTT